jgi:hypothetical protein
MKWWQSIYRALALKIGNRVTEKEIRAWLIANGFHGASAELPDITLHAIFRPGWRQVYRFSGRAKDSDGKLVPIFGVLEGDQRYGDSKISIYHNLKEQTQRLKQVSDGMIVRKH